MPYDPDWDLGNGVYGAANASGPTAGNSASTYGEDEGRIDVEQEEPDQDEEGGEVLEEAEDIEVDVPQPGSYRHGDQGRYPEPGTEATPRSRLPFPGVAALSREVVLHPSLKRDAYTPLGDYVDETTLVSSDLMPRPKSPHPEAPAAKPPVLPPPENKQPPAAASPLPPVTPQPKKRGRPFGWRLGAGSYSAMRSGLPPGTVLATPKPKPKKPATDQKPRRRSRRPAPTARQIYLKLNPHFITFRCEWENCPAELQNLETLRKHLLVVHGRPSKSSKTPEAESITCKWHSCRTPNLASASSFASHVETVHLPSFLWHVGDGPRNSTPTPALTVPSATPTTAPIPKNPHSSPKETPLPSYLFNAAGEQVTPSIRDQQLESEDDRKKRQARLNRVIWQRDQNAPEEPEYTAREMEEMKRVAREKLAKQEMLREYAVKVRRAGMEEWRGLLA
ncbi:hypothetical protein VTI74DRAFT_9316 [Chaetomium olivicolor]